MNRLAVGTVIAIAALAMNGGLVRDVLGDQPIRPTPTLSSPIPGASGYRSERVLSLVLALEALRAAPEVLSAPTPRG